MNCQGFKVKTDLKGLGTPILGRKIFSKKREYMLAPLVNFLKPYQDKKKIPRLQMCLYKILTDI